MDHQAYAASEGFWLQRSSSTVDGNRSRQTYAAPQGSRLNRSSSVVEGSGGGGAISRWKPTTEQKQILESIYSAGVRNPNIDQINDITARLQIYGSVEGKNIFYWFQNNKAKEKRNKDGPQTKGSKWSLFASKKWTSLFKRRSSDKNVVQEAETSSSIRRNSVDASEFRTLELFPLHPDH